MIFNVSPDQIKGLKSDDLVHLLRRLMYAEAQLAGIDLRNVSAPLQITVADGGEDARVAWEGGHSKTSHFPARYTVFQAKATAVSPAGWRRETWTKTSARRGAKRKLNTAITMALDKRGAYIGFTRTPMVGPTHDKCIQAIKDGIVAGGGDPSRLSAIDIYDANKIATWASRHPSVAAWVNEKLTGVTLSGFQTIDGWASRGGLAAVPLVDDAAARFVLRVHARAQEGEIGAGDEEKLTAAQAGSQVVDQLSQSRKVVRLFGPSGHGKSRFALELLREASGLLKESAASSAICCDYRNVGVQVLQMAVDFAQRGVSALLIVDECPRGIAMQLLDIATSEGSELRILTVGIDDQPIINNDCVNISVGPSDGALIEKIIRARLPNGTNEEVEYIRDLCGGIPQIAVLATENYVKGAPVLGSIGDVVERILIGSGVTDPGDVRAIEVLSLFERLGADEEPGEQLDFVASHLLETSGDRMYESLARASEHLLVHRRGRYFTAQPPPIADFLGLRRLKLIRVNALMRFIDEAPPKLLKHFFRSWRRFDASRTVVKVAEILLSWTGKFGSREALENDIGAESLDALVHVAPDAAADALQRAFGEVPLDELMSVRGRSRRYLVWALEKLVFRRASFANSARMLMRFAAVENENISNNATGQFIQLFQWLLSGTQAAPGERFAVLDEGLMSADDRVVAVCVNALAKTLQNGRFMRSGDSGKLGSKAPLKEWRPKSRREIFDYWREGIKRLMQVRAAHPKLARQCKSILASHLRGMVHSEFLNDIEALTSTIASADGTWFDAIRGISDWIYYDSNGVAEEFVQRVRALREKRMPVDPIDKARLYTKFWSADIHDPDVVYANSDHDFEYSSRMARKLAAEIASDPVLTERAIRSMTAEELHNVHPFAQELALHVANPVAVFQLALDSLEAATDHKGTQFVRALLNGIESRDSEAGNTCFQLALKSNAFRDQAVNLFTSVTTTPARLEVIVNCLRDGTLNASHCSYLSYGKGLDGLSAAQLAPLLGELCAKGANGLWTALEIITMYQHDRKSLDPIIEGFAKKITTEPEALSQSRDSSRDGHLFAENVERLIKHNRLDDEYCAALIAQVVRLCHSDDYIFRNNLDDAVRKIISILVQQKPSLIWTLLATFYETATPTQRNVLETYVGPDRHGFEGASQSRAGVLFSVPETLMLDWAKKAPQDRAGFLCTFYPVFLDSENGTHEWDPAMERLATEFGAVKEFRDALSDRMEINSWSGSKVPLLRAYFQPLEKWEIHPIPQMAEWARDKRRRLDRSIERERQRDEEG